MQPEPMHYNNTGVRIWNGGRVGFQNLGYKITLHYFLAFWLAALIFSTNQNACKNSVA